MHKTRTVTVDYGSGKLIISGYYSRAYIGTPETPPEPSSFGVTSAYFIGDGSKADIGAVPSDLLADGIWDKLGELARREVEERERSERDAYAERDDER